MKIKWWYPALLAIPAAGVMWYENTFTASAGRYNVWVFALSLVALIPLAQLSGDVTESLSEYLSPLVKGLLDASLSNVPELAIGVLLFVQGILNPIYQTDNFLVVRGLLIGSVINNVLFTLGIATFIGAYRHGRLRFDKEQAAGYASMLALAVVGLALPTLATSFSRLTGGALRSAETNVSLVVGGILIVSYIAYVGSSIFKWGEKPAPAAGAGEGEATVGRASAEHLTEHHAAEHAKHSEHGEHGEHGEGHEGHEGHKRHEEEIMTAAREERMERERELEAKRLAEEKAEQERLERRKRSGGLFVLATLGFTIVTLITVGMCYTLTTVTEPVIQETALTPLSVGLIIFPIICNFGEILEAIQLSWKRDMEGAMEIAAGSSVQVPLFVAPLLVFIAYFLSLGGLTAPMTLIFPALELIVVGLVTFVYALVNLDGETSWLEGAQLLAFYAMITVTAFALPGA